VRKTELPALTGIRFYAALFVFLSHVSFIPGMGALSGERLVFNAGVVGVSFFFVLSGFILTYNYAEVFRNGVSRDDYKRFVWGRLTKIWPVHLATMLLVLPIAILSPQLPLDWRAVPVHALMLQCFCPLTQPGFYQFLNVPSWSISCEWFFYLLAPMTFSWCWGACAGGCSSWRPSQLTLVVLAGCSGLADQTSAVSTWCPGSRPPGSWSSWSAYSWAGFC
jgi:peptidoglycan/LPS O-acetylase OafA/YrhL